MQERVTSISTCSKSSGSIFWASSLSYAWRPFARWRARPPLLCGHRLAHRRRNALLIEGDCGGEEIAIEQLGGGDADADAEIAIEQFGGGDAVADAERARTRAGEVGSE